jgi:hypothetical protein
MQMTAEDIERVAGALRAELASPEGEVAWWRATIDLTDAIRRNRCTREASLAAHRAAAAVQAAAKAAGIDDDKHRDDVTAVARAAAEVARVDILLATVQLPAATTEAILQPWAPLAA